MCGIVGIVNGNGQPIVEDLLRRMRDVMHYRGPDDAGLHIDGHVGLGHRRLSILDLSAAGHQPMSNHDGTVWLILNGEIYNFLERRAELEARGHRFRTNTDTEVLIALYEEYGTDCLRYLRGMFAFAIWDSRRSRLFAARDRLGIKPFYYYWNGTRLIFASEIKAILEDPNVVRQANYDAIADYLFVGMPLGSKSLFRNIHQLDPGSTLVWHNGQIETAPYWDLCYDYDTVRSHDDTVAHVTAVLEEAVHIHCRSDAPLGVHLSGGLDTSSVAALAARHYDPLKAFAIRAGRDDAFDETRYARAVARDSGIQYIEGEPGAPDLSRLLPGLIWHMDLPMPNPGGFAYFTVSQLARSSVTVALTGHGGDEVFAGYPAQFQAAFGSTSMFSASPFTPAPKVPLPQRLLRTLRRYGVAGVARRIKGRFDRRLPAFETLWMQLHTGFPPHRNPMLSSEFISTLGGYTPIDDYLQPLRTVQTDELLDKCLYHDLRSYLPALLHMEDRVSMAMSLESRVPLLDHVLVELLATVPPTQKVSDLEPKHLLREALRGRLPENVRTRRDKTPFAMPLPAWFNGDLSPMIDDLLESPRTHERGIFDPGALQRPGLSFDQLWIIVNLEMWFRIFIECDRDLLDRTDAVTGGNAALAPAR